MLNYDPKKRPTASECLQYPIFQVRVQFPLNAPDFEHQEDRDLEDLLLDKKPSTMQKEVQ